MITTTNINPRLAVPPLTSTDNLAAAKLLTTLGNDAEQPITETDLPVVLGAENPNEQPTTGENLPTLPAADAKPQFRTIAQLAEFLLGMTQESRQNLLGVDQTRSLIAANSRVLNTKYNELAVKSANLTAEQQKNAADKERTASILAACGTLAQAATSFLNAGIAIHGLREGTKEADAQLASNQTLKNIKDDQLQTQNEVDNLPEAPTGAFKLNKKDLALGNVQAKREALETKLADLNCQETTLKNEALDTAMKAIDRRLKRVEYSIQAVGGTAKGGLEMASGNESADAAKDKAAAQQNEAISSASQSSLDKLTKTEEENAQRISEMIKQWFDSLAQSVDRAMAAERSAAS